jgi:hypothetical protein
MKITKKGVCLILMLIFSIPLIFSAQTIVVPQEQPEQEQGFLSKSLGFLKSPIFWWIVIGVVILIAIIIGLFFLLRWIVKFLKSRNNIFWQLRTHRIKLAKIHRRYPSKHFLKTEKNFPIRLVREQNGHTIVSEPIAYHRGDYTSHEGNIIISMNMRFNKKFWFFPITDLLIIPNKEKVEIEQRTEKGKTIKIIIDNLPLAKDIVQFNENEILVYADSLSNIGSSGNEFYIPVLRAKDGKIINLSLPIYQSLKEVILGDYLLEQSDEFVRIAKKSIDMNPQLRYAMKSGDSSQSVEIPQTQGR